MVRSPCSLRDSQEASPTPQFKSINSSVLSFVNKGLLSDEIKRRLLFGRKTITNLDSRLKSRELDYKESWAPKNWCFWTVMVEKTLESPSDCKEIQPVHPKGNQTWIFIERTDAKAETPIFWAPDVKKWLIWKDPNAGKDWRQEKEMTENEMVGCHHWLNGHEFE